MSELTPDLSAKFLIDDTFVVVPSGLKPFKLPRKGKELSLLTIESHSETWSVTERRLRRWAAGAGVDLNVSNTLQNFMAVTQLSRAGFGNGLAPIGVPLVLGIPKQKLVQFPGESLKIPVSMVGRRSTLERGIVVKFYESLKENLEKYWIYESVSYTHLTLPTTPYV